MSSLATDLRYALRVYRRNPGFAALAVLALALGIGATAAMFGAADAVVFGAYRGIPSVERVVQVWDRFPSTEPGQEVQVSVPNFEDYSAQQRSFEKFAAFQPTPLYLETGEGQVSLRGLHASADLLSILDVRPALGRGFTPESDIEGTAPVALLAHHVWEERFGGAADVVGRTITMARFKPRQGFVQEAYEIVGVLPADFALPPLKLRHDFEPMLPPDVVLPLGLWTWGRGNRGMYALRVLGRLRPDATVERAHAELAATAAHIAEAYPETNKGYSVHVTPLPELVRQVHGRRMGILAAAAALLLLIACANVAGLLLGRAKARERELAVRVSLGASRMRILQQLLTESALLGLLGGAAGIAVAWAITRALALAAPAGIYNLDTLQLDGKLLAFALAAGLGTSILFGLLPGLRGARADADRVLRGAVHGHSRSRARGLRSAVVAQIALAFVLLSGSGLLLATLANLLRADPGFDGEQVLLYPVETLPPPFTRHMGRDAQAALYDRTIERVTAFPGVIAAASVSRAPLHGTGANADFTIADRDAPPPEERPDADWFFAAPGYFRAMGIQLIEGRDFTDAELHRPEVPDGAPLPELPAIVNDRFASRYWPGESALGKIFFWGTQDPKTVRTGSYESGWDTRYPRPFPLRIVGVVREVNMIGLADENRLQYYTPGEGLNGRWLVARVSGDPAAIAEPLRRAIEGVDSELRADKVVPMTERVADAAAVTRFQLLTIGTFALLATLLAAVGVFGVMAFLVRQRTHELGVRLAIGARPADVLRMVLSQGAAMAALGLAIGVAVFLAAARVLGAMLYGVSPTDARALAAGAVVLAIAALAASLAPALRAARIDPMQTLRAE